MLDRVRCQTWTPMTPPAATTTAMRSKDQGVVQPAAGRVCRSPSRLLICLRQLAVVPQFREGLLPGWMPGRHGAAALKLGVELGAEQDGDIGDPHPDQEDDDAGEAAVDLVVVAEVGDVHREQSRGNQP